MHLNFELARILFLALRTPLPLGPLLPFLLDLALGSQPVLVVELEEPGHALVALEVQKVLGFLLEILLLQIVLGELFYIIIQVKVVLAGPARLLLF